MSEKSQVVYDAMTISNAEIVAPGIDKKEPYLEARALRQGMLNNQTADAIKSIVGDRDKIKLNEAPTILRAVANVLIARRENKANIIHDNASHKSVNSFSADDINALNSKLWN